jgi:hypothetical protein
MKVISETRIQDKINYINYYNKLFRETWGIYYLFLDIYVFIGQPLWNFYKKFLWRLFWP